MENKNLDDYFCDWEGHFFGFGYGSGEPYVLPLLKDFLNFIPERGSYDHRFLEEQFHPVVTWLLINTLCHADIFEYGTSPRSGWLTNKGVRLKAYLKTKSYEELIKNVCNRTEDYVRCYPNACNCGEQGYEQGRICPNPFWIKAR